MKEIAFDKASPADTQPVIDTAIPTAPAPVPEQRWRAQRGSSRTENEELTPPAFTWLSQLPEAKRPDHLASQFPRIVNQLADLWKRPLRCELYLDTLAVDFRGGRRGFPPEIANEIAVLKNYYTTEVAPVRHDVWGDRIGMADD